MAAKSRDLLQLSTDNDRDSESQEEMVSAWFSLGMLHIIWSIFTVAETRILLRDRGWMSQTRRSPDSDISLLPLNQPVAAEPNEPPSANYCPNSQGGIVNNPRELD